MLYLNLLEEKYGFYSKLSICMEFVRNRERKWSIKLITIPQTK